MMDSVIIAHNERFLTYVTRQQRIVGDRMVKIGELYDLMIDHLGCLIDCGALDEFQQRMRGLLELEAQEAEVLESMAESNLRMVEDSDGA